jgi:hypothetical protein
MKPGSYLPITPSLSRGEFTHDTHVEGMRLDWNAVLPCCLPKDEGERRGFLLALTILCNMFEPDTKPRSLPVWHLQEQLDRVRIKVEDEIQHVDK